MRKRPYYSNEATTRLYGEGGGPYYFYWGRPGPAR